MPEKLGDGEWFITWRKGRDSINLRDKHHWRIITL